MGCWFRGYLARVLPNCVLFGLVNASIRYRHLEGIRLMASRTVSAYEIGSSYGTAATPAAWKYWRYLWKTGELVPAAWPSKTPWQRGWNTAVCEPLSGPWQGSGPWKAHSGLTPDCPCGIHACSESAGIASMLRKFGCDGPGLIVIGRVELSGEVLPTGFAADPPGTIRAERARLQQLDVTLLTALRPQLGKDAARRLGKRYIVPVTLKDGWRS